MKTQKLKCPQCGHEHVLKISSDKIIGVTVSVFCPQCRAEDRVKVQPDKETPR